MVPIVKSKYPDFDGKTRQTLIRAAWKKLKDEFKFTYVQMSRADRERALYVHRLTQIKDELLAHSGARINATASASENPVAQGIQNIEKEIACEIEKSIINSDSELTPSDDENHY